MFPAAELYKADGFSLKLVLLVPVRAEFEARIPHSFRFLLTFNLNGCSACVSAPTATPPPSAPPNPHPAFALHSCLHLTPDLFSCQTQTLAELSRTEKQPSADADA